MRHIHAMNVQNLLMVTSVNLYGTGGTVGSQYLDWGHYDECPPNI